MAEYTFRVKDNEGRYRYGERATVTSNEKYLRMEDNMGYGHGKGRIETLEKLIGYDSEGKEIWCKIFDNVGNFRAKDSYGKYVYGDNAIIDYRGENVSLKYQGKYVGSACSIGTLEKSIGYDHNNKEIWHKVGIFYKYDDWC